MNLRKLSKKPKLTVKKDQIWMIRPISLQTSLSYHCIHKHWIRLLMKCSATKEASRKLVFRSEGSACMILWLRIVAKLSFISFYRKLIQIPLKSKSRSSSLNLSSSKGQRTTISNCSCLLITLTYSRLEASVTGNY